MGKKPQHATFDDEICGESAGDFPPSQTEMGARRHAGHTVMTTPQLGCSCLYIYILTAGNAKNEMAKTEKHEATILPIHVWGTVSP